jgi:hypothetical protein
LRGEPVLYAPLADCSKSARNGVDCYHTSFEETYTVRPLPDFPTDRPAFLPILVDHGTGRPKVLVTEADLTDYRVCGCARDRTVRRSSPASSPRTRSRRR